MAAQNLPPTSIAVQTNLTGAVTDIDESPDSPDANWLTASGSSALRVLFDTPTMAPVGSQTFRVWARCTNNGTYSQSLYPDATTTTTGFAAGGTASTVLDGINEAPSSFVSYAEPTADSHLLYGTFGTPTMSGNPGGTQTIRVYCAKYKIGTGFDAGGGDPTISLLVKDGGNALTTTPATNQNVTSGTGEWISWTFTAPANDGSGINFEITCTDNGGGANKRHVAIDSVEWQAVGANAGASYDLDVYENGSKVGDVTTGSVSSTSGQMVSGTWAHTLLGTADGSLVELYITQTGGSEYLEIGAVEWQAVAQVKGELYMGNSTDGASLVFTSDPGTAPFSTLGYKEVYSESPTVVPNTTEYARAGFGSTVSNTGSVAADALIVMVLDAPNAGYDIHAVASFPYHLRRISKRTNIKTLINL